MRHRSPANTLQALDQYWRASVTGAERAERNLHEIQPGYPSTTPGNGSPGGGSGGHGTSITERLACDDKLHDPAFQALHEYADIVKLIETELIRLHGIIAQYDYPTAGEHSAGANIRKAAVKDVNKYAEPGCVSCGRPEFMKWEPIHRSALCRWCADFQRAEKMLPPLDLLQLRHSGKKITQPIVTASLKAARATKKTVPSSRTKKKTA